MAFDGVFLHFMVDELKNNLLNGKINKIQQISLNDIVFTIRNNSQNLQLLISTMPESSRVQITNLNYDKLAFPPTFNMFLKKRLLNGKIINIDQFENDRVILFKILSVNDIKDKIEINLIVELFGKGSNIIITDQDYKILESLKHIPPFSESDRTIYPGVEYKFPKQSKLNPFSVDCNYELLNPKDIVNKFQGISPKLANLLFDNNILLKGYFNNLEILPNIYEIDAKKYYTIIKNKNTIKQFDSLSELLDSYYEQKEKSARLKQKSKDLEIIIKREIEKNIKKINKLQNDLDKAKNYDIYKQSADLIYMNIHNIKKGQTNINTINIFDNNSEISIQLDPQKNAVDNANLYYSKYRKSKSAIDHINKQLDLTNKEIEYFELLKDQLTFANFYDVIEIRDELISNGYIKKREKNKSFSKKKKPNFETYITEDNFRIYVGKNNIQNEYLTHKEANRNDFWFHAKDIPGSHVILQGDKKISENAIRTAAILAAYHSKAKYSSSVPVDYTLVRNIKSIPGKKKCFVTYDNHKTIYIDPDEDIIKEIKKAN